jgi:hypothetical protein
MDKLLTRDEFRNAVFQRDGHKCIFCGKTDNLDAHHICERRLFGDSGGYFLSNGATVCDEHHLACEMTTISCEEVREKAGITKVILPEHLYDDYTYTKWGDIVLPSGQRLKGELFFDESVQKILKVGGVLDRYIKYTKYPRSWHAPFSESLTKDDKQLKNMDHFHNKEVVVTLKMDGENSNIYNDYYHARSIDGNSHPSQNWLKNFIAQWQHEIPEGWKFVGENLYAKHSIHYDNLPTYFMLFSIFNEKNVCLSWDEVEEWAKLLDLETVPVIYRGIYDEKNIRSLYTKDMRDTVEGYVIRLASSFTYGNFKNSLAKVVRSGHVAEVVHNWKTKPVIPNGLKKE